MNQAQTKRSENLHQGPYSPNWSQYTSNSEPSHKLIVAVGTAVLLAGLVVADYLVQKSPVSSSHQELKVNGITQFAPVRQPPAENPKKEKETAVKREIIGAAREPASVPVNSQQPRTAENREMVGMVESREVPRQAEELEGTWISVAGNVCPFDCGMTVLNIKKAGTVMTASRISDGCPQYHADPRFSFDYSLLQGGRTTATISVGTAGNRERDPNKMENRTLEIIDKNTMVIYYDYRKSTFVRQSQ